MPAESTYCCESYLLFRASAVFPTSPENDDERAISRTSDLPPIIFGEMEFIKYHFINNIFSFNNINENVQIHGVLGFWGDRKSVV